MLKKISRQRAVSALFLNALLIVDVHIEVGAVLLGKRNAFIVNHGCMLDRGNSRPNRVLNSFWRMRMSSNAQSEVTGLIDSGLQFLGCELLRFWIAAMCQHRAAR